MLSFFQLPQDLFAQELSKASASLLTAGPLQGEMELNDDDACVNMTMRGAVVVAFIFLTMHVDELENGSHAPC